MWGAIFPGQGSQQVGMGKYLFDNFEKAKLLLEEASDSAGVNFKKLLFDGPEDQLQLTENTQPAIVLCSTMAFECFKQETDIKISTSSGHSVGEYSALTASNCLTFSDSIAAVKKRGYYMQNSVPKGQGGMSAVMGLSKEQTQRLCDFGQKETNLTIEIANINAPGQIVISGSKKALDHLSTLDLKSIFNDDNNPPKRIKLIALKVSAPFHCSLMKEAALEMEKTLDKINFSNPIFTVVQNTEANNYVTVGAVKKALIDQVSNSVLWIDCVNKMSESTNKFIEFGNGSVLKGLLKKINPQLEVLNLNSMEEFKESAIKVTGS